MHYYLPFTHTLYVTHVLLPIKNSVNVWYAKNAPTMKNM